MSIVCSHDTQLIIMSSNVYMRGARGPNKCGAAIGTTRVKRKIEEDKKEKERKKLPP